MKKLKTALLIAIFLSPVPALFNSCGPTVVTDPQRTQETIVGNPIVEVQVASFTTTARKWTPVSQAQAAVTNLIWCFQRLHLRPAGDDKVRHIIPFTRDEVSISSSGTKIENLPVPIGRYDLILVELKDNCLPSYKSVQVTNSNGRFSTTNQIHLAFDGDVAVEDSASTITFDIQNFVRVLNTVTSGPEIAPAMDSVRGIAY